MSVRLRSIPPAAAPLLAAALAAGLLAGCGHDDSTSGALPSPAPVTAGATATPIPTPGPTPAEPTTTRPVPAPPQAPAPHPEAPAPAPALPWPPGDASRLQAAVDGGAQPWLLDPVDLAQSYAAAARGWTDADATRQSPTTVDVRSGGSALRLTVTQPGRTGVGGIWLVTAARQL